MPRPFRYSLSFFFFLFLCSFRLFGQTHSIIVHIGDSRAEYAFILLNNEYLGTCNEKGEFCLDPSMVRIGDRLCAEFAGIRSSDLVFTEKTKSCLTFQIPVKELRTSTIAAKNSRILKEYLKIIRSIRFCDTVFGQKYRIDYNLQSSSTTISIEDSSMTEIALIHGHDKDDPPLFWETFGKSVDTLVNDGVATAFLYASELTWFIHDRGNLKKAFDNKSLLFHKVVTESGDICYHIIEGINRNNQTTIHFSKDLKRIESIYRSFIGSGSIVTTTTDKTTHSILVTFEQNKKKTAISTIKMLLHVPEVNNTWTQITLISPHEVKMTIQEQTLAQERMNQYLQGKRVAGD